MVKVALRLLLLPVLLLISAGCLSHGADQLLPADLGMPDANPAHVVVALVDTGITPWHEAFALVSATVPSEPPVPAERVPPSFRSELEIRGVEAWNDLEPGVLYWFEGTRILAISKIAERSGILRPTEVLFPTDPHRIYDDVNHGTATASVVARTSPHAWIVMVEADALDLDAVQWTMEQPWIDVISYSFGSVGHIPGNVTSGRDERSAAFQEAVDAGKLVVVAAGNEPDPNLLSESGAPWVISVGGAEGDRQGVTVLTSQPVDVVANFTHHGLASARDDSRTFSAKGTSFGAPLVAGVLAEVIHTLRQQHGHEGGIQDGALVRTEEATITNRDLRWALNMTARYWNLEGWDPTKTAVDIDPLVTAREITAPALPHVHGTPVGPWLQMGWGYVDASTTQDVVASLSGEAAPPDKADAAAYMEALFAARSTVWDLYQSRPVADRAGFQGNP